MVIGIQKTDDRKQRTEPGRLKEGIGHGAWGKSYVYPTTC
jgi:hypothetical protein